MKKLIAVLSLLLIFSVSAFADKRSDIKKLIEISGSQELMDQIIDTLLPQYEQLLPEVPSAFWDKAASKMKNKAPELIDNMVDLYDKYYSTEEIKELVIFYESDIGKKTVQIQPLIMEDSMKIGQQWGYKLAEELTADLISSGYIQ